MFFANVATVRSMYPTLSNTFSSPDIVSILGQ